MDNFFVVIALLTDFGTADYFVAAMKGTILTINSAANIVDLTHEIGRQDVQGGAYVLRACYRDFPLGTIFVCVVDPGVGSERRAIIVDAEDRIFLAPDNGLLGLLFDEDPEARAFELSNRDLFADKVSSTFHGRDIFAPAAAHLSTGFPIEQAGPPITDVIRLDTLEPSRIGDRELAGEIIHIDRFGNLVTNFTSKHLSTAFHLKLGPTIIDHHADHYSEAAPGELLSIMGSSGFIEISASLDSAELILGAKRGDRVILLQESVD